MKKAVILLVLGMVLACMTATAIDGEGPETGDHNPDAPNEYGNNDDPALNGEGWEDEDDDSSPQDDPCCSGGDDTNNQDQNEADNGHTDSETT